MLVLERMVVMPNVNNKEERGDCTVKGCKEWVCAGGLCNKHYLKRRIHGDPALGREISPRGLPPEDRFRLIGWTEVESGCWEWNGSLDGSGYGQFFQRINGSPKRVGVHRLALEIHLGRKLAGVGIDKEYALHRWDNRKCVNPEHLLVGTHRTNMRDMRDKGRANRKFSDTVINEVHRLRNEEGLLQREIAEKFDISPAYVSQVLSGIKRSTNQRGNKND